jgi:AraC-like DNA-binding protein
MAAKTAPPDMMAASFRFSTDDLSPGERAAVWREVYGRSVLRLEIEPLTQQPFSSEIAINSLPGIDIVRGTSSPFRVGRTRELLQDGDDGLILQLTNVVGRASQFGRDIAVSANDAVLLSNADVGSFTFPAACTVLALRLRRGALAPLVRDLDLALVRPVPRQNEALRLLIRYLGMLDEAPLTGPTLQRLAAAHVYDLVAVAMGATGEAAEIAHGGGIRAARLHAAKAYIAENLQRPGLSLDEIAGQLRISPRSVQALFEAEGTTFSRVVLEERLLRAYRRLTGPLSRDRSVTAVAFEAGFNDLSYFNRTFRRRFGLTPSEARRQRPRKRRAGRRGDPIGRPVRSLRRSCRSRACRRRAAIAVAAAVNGGAAVMPRYCPATIGISHRRWRRHIIGRLRFDVDRRRDIGPVEHRVRPEVRPIEPPVAVAVTVPAKEVGLRRRRAKPEAECRDQRQSRGSQFQSPAHCHLPSKILPMTRTA